MRRLTRFLVTESPTAVDTTKPTDGTSCAQSETVAWTTMVDFPARTPPRTVRLKSPERRMRCAAGNTELRQRARNGPCGDGLRGLRDPHGCACAAGSRGSSHGAGCSAGRSACSRGTPKHVGGSASSIDTLNARPSARCRHAKATEPAVKRYVERDLQVKLTPINHKSGQFAATVGPFRLAHFLVLGQLLPDSQPSFYTTVDGGHPPVDRYPTRSTSL